MQIARLTSKGQLVIPKPIRDSLHVRPGTDFNVTLENGRIILEARHAKTRGFSDWQGRNPKAVKLALADLCKPVTDYDK